MYVEEGVSVEVGIFDVGELSVEAVGSGIVSIRVKGSVSIVQIASWCCYRVLCNTTLLISNIMGPSEEIMIADNPVISMKLTISGQPHVQINEQAITMHMVSYAGQANLQVMVAKDIIHDLKL
ncbi:O-acyltransferase WSD1 [Bienertia sinuspersici]